MLLQLPKANNRRGTSSPASFNSNKVISIAVLPGDAIKSTMQGSTEKRI